MTNYTDNPISSIPAAQKMAMEAQLRAGVLATGPGPTRGPSTIEQVVTSLQMAMNDVMNAVARLESRLAPLTTNADMRPERVRETYSVPMASSMLGSGLREIALTLENNVVHRLTELHDALEV